MTLEGPIAMENEADINTATNSQPEPDAREAMAAQAMMAAVKLIDGNATMRDVKGRYVPLETVSASDQLQDQTVRRLMFFAGELSDEIARFKGHAFKDVGDFVDILKQEYGEDRGGEKGNTTLMSYDGTLRVTINVADLIEFGPEIGVAKALFDECVSAWSKDSSPEIRAIIGRAFNMEGGQYNRAELFSLLRLDIDDDKWRDAKRALQDAIRTVGTKEYMRFQRRDDTRGKWQTVTIDLAKA